jgi:hypothetical protein
MVRPMMSCWLILRREMKSDTDFRLLDVYYLYTLYISSLGNFLYIQGFGETGSQDIGVI